MKSQSLVATVSAFCLVVSVASSQTRQPVERVAPPKPHILVLGTFHMDNPGQDLFNLQVDDVLVPKRQKEIEDFLSVLKKFRPTKIAIEARFGSEKIQKEYEDYRAGKYALTRNEIDQIGYRLAKELGHTQIYPIDIKGDFPFDKVEEFSEKHGQQQSLQDMMAQVPKEIQRMSAILKNGTIADLFHHLNRDEQVRSDNQFYMSLVRYAGDGEYPGPDLLAAWYQRNIRIFANLRSIIDSPEDRVLVIYGSGHSYWLQRDVLDSQDLILDRVDSLAQ